MNKIVIENNTVSQKYDDAIICNVFNTKHEELVIEVFIIADTSLELLSINNSKNYNLSINVNRKVNAHISEFFSDICSDVIKVYNLDEYSNLKINKFYDVNTCFEKTTVNLNGHKASLDYEFTTICKNKEEYDLRINHNAKETVSNVVNKGVNIECGELVFNIDGFVPNNIIDCVVNQNSRIINLTNNKCQINPNLLIDENDIEASHSAHIGKFSDDEIFYLKSRGIDYKTAYNLLIRGFLMNGNSNYSYKIDELINKYWR